MPAEFVQPSFEGSRFDEHTLPLDVAKDLAAYEVLVIELAKHLYLKEHPDRQRVPKGFTADFQLHLIKLEEGSTRPLLGVVKSAVVAGGLSAGLFAGEPDTDLRYFEKARDVISLCIESDGQQIPTDFPKHLLNHFNNFGRSLHEGESLKFSGPSGSTATLTPERRRKLVLAADSVYEKDVELIGSISEADWQRNTFRILLMNGESAVIQMNEDFHEKARRYGGRPRDQVIVKCTAAYDSYDRLQKVISIESIEISPDYQLATRLEELASLSDGWIEESGLAPDKDGLTKVSKALIGRFPEKTPLPYIVPTPDGGLLLEWNLPGSPSVDIDLKNMSADFHAFTDDTHEVEKAFALSTDSEWNAFLKFLSEYFGNIQA